ncbi:hypothetical protein LINPERHAP1_LOCUS1811, partial [Linum perenne]
TLNSNQAPPAAPPIIDPTDPFVHHQPFISSSPSIQMSTSEVVNLISQQEPSPPMSPHVRSDGHGKKVIRSNSKLKGSRFGISEEELWDK